MNRTQQQQPTVCQHFLRGSCRFGARCRYSHATSGQQQQQQQQPQQQFQQYQQQPQGGLTWRREDQRQQQPGHGGGGGGGGGGGAVTDHRCDVNRKSCWLQIKEDFQTQRPSFWRLTCYAHWKHLPNDVVGDHSFEELRWDAYCASQQGQSLAQVIQRERSLSAAKENEFSQLFQKPYNGPIVSQWQPPKTTFPPPPPLLSQQQMAPTTTMLFGKPVVASSQLNWSTNQQQQQQQQQQNQARMPFAVAQPGGPFQPPSAGGGGFGNQSPFGLPAGSTGTPFAGVPHAPFGTASNASFGGGGFNVTASGGGAGGGGGGAMPGIFGGNVGLGGGFGNTQHAGAAGFVGAGAGFLQNGANNLPPIGGGSFAGSASLSGGQAVVGGEPGGEPRQASNQSAPSVNNGEDIWLKERWSLGEIPEEEPPLYARF